jgi:hypothetical protein
MMASPPGIVFQPQMMTQTASLHEKLNFTALQEDMRKM